MGEGCDHHEKMENLVKSLMLGMCVPFLGAGMAYEADPEGGHRLRTEHLQCRLRGKVLALVERGVGIPESIMQRLACLDLSRLAEVIEQYSCKGLRDAVEPLGLEDWHEVAPTKAHRYLAFLVRERHRAGGGAVGRADGDRGAGDVHVVD